MKKSTTIVFTLLTTILLTACNTTESDINSEETPKADSELTTEANENQKEENQETTNSSTSTTTSTPNESESNASQSNAINNETSILKNQDITYTFNNKDFQAPTTTVTSKELGYTISLADGFTLTSEEPGSDIIFFNEDNNYSMRIKTYTTEETTYNNLLKDVENTVVASTNNSYETINIEQNAYNIAKGKQFISVEEATGLQTITVLFEKENRFVVLTIFDGPTNSLKEAFLQMAYTIK